MPEHVAQIPHAPTAAATLERFHRDTVQQVAQAVSQHDVVVVGMAWNPHVPRARKMLDAAGIPHHDIDIGSYVSQWRPRLALKLWAGWPTFPMVFVRGQLVGGASDLQVGLADGSVQALIDAPRDEAVA